MQGVTKTESLEDLNWLIGDYIDYAKSKHVSPIEALSQLIYCMSGVYFKKSLLNASDDEPEMRLFLFRAQVSQYLPFINALKNACANYCADSDLTSLISNRLHFAALAMAYFHKEYTNAFPNLFTFTAKLNELDSLVPENLKVIRFCIECYGPNIILKGHLDESSRKVQIAKDIIDSCPRTTQFTFEECGIRELKEEAFHIYIQAALKAKELVLDKERLDLWSVDQWKQFVSTLNKAPQLKSLSMMNTNLDRCCQDPKKLNFILELIYHPNIQVLNLHKNKLNDLPLPIFKTLLQAIKDVNMPTKEVKWHIDSYRKELFFKNPQLFEPETQKPNESLTL